MATPKKNSARLELSHQQEAALARRADQLMSIVGLVDAPLEVPTPEELREIFDLIKAKQSLKALPLQAMLATTAATKADEVFPAWVTVAAIDQMEGDRTESTYVLACRRIRLLNLGDDPALVKALADLPFGLSEIVSYLTDVSKQHSEDGPLHTRIGHLHALLDSYQTKQSRQSTRRLHQTTLPWLFAGEGGHIQQLREHSSTDEDGRETARSLLDIDPKSPPTHRAHLDFRRHHTAVQGQRLTSQKMLSPRKGVSLVCRWWLPVNVPVKSVRRSSANAPTFLHTAFRIPTISITFGGSFRVKPSGFWIR